MAKIAWEGGTYEGQVKGGVPHGHGTWTNPPFGNMYVGEYKDGKRHGHGTMTYQGGLSMLGS